MPNVTNRELLVLNLRMSWKNARPQPDAIASPDTKFELQPGCIIPRIGRSSVPSGKESVQMYLPNQPPEASSRTHVLIVEFSTSLSGKGLYYSAVDLFPSLSLSNNLLSDFMRVDLQPYTAYFSNVFSQALLSRIFLDLGWNIYPMWEPNFM